MVFKLKQNFQKHKVVADKSPFFVIGPFFTHHSIFLNIGFWQGSLEWKCCIFNLGTLKRFSSFFEKVFVSQKICLKFKVSKTFEISSDCHIKTCRSLKQRALLKVPSTFFLRRTYALSVGFKLKPLRRSVFLCWNKIQSTVCRKTCWKKQLLIFYLMNLFFKHLYLVI